MTKISLKSNKLSKYFQNKKNYQNTSKTHKMTKIFSKPKKMTKIPPKKNF